MLPKLCFFKLVSMTISFKGNHKGFGIVNKAEIDVFLELSCFFDDPAAAAAAKSLQSCLTLCNPIDGSPPGPAVTGILQARTLEWVAISFSNARK